MKALRIYGSLLIVFGLFCFYIFSSFHQKLEDDFIGSWEEASWEYKQADNFLLKHFGFGDHSIKNKEDIRTHKGDKWTFKKDGVLEIKTDDITNQLFWCLRGRGNILEISDGVITEHFDIKRMQMNQIELQYISDIQLREQAKLIIVQKNNI